MQRGAGGARRGRGSGWERTFLRAALRLALRARMTKGARCSMKGEGGESSSQRRCCTHWREDGAKREPEAVDVSLVAVVVMSRLRRGI